MEDSGLNWEEKKKAEEEEEEKNYFYGGGLGIRVSRVERKSKRSSDSRKVMSDCKNLETGNVFEE